MTQMYVLARSFLGHATLQHALLPNQFGLTCCGRDISTWSREYTTIRYEKILCLSCRRSAGVA